MEQLGVVAQLGDGKAVEVVEIAGVVPVDHCLCLAAEQFFEFENEIPTRCGIPDRDSVQFLRRQRAGSHQEVDFYLDAGSDRPA